MGDNSSSLNFVTFSQSFFSQSSSHLEPPLAHPGAKSHLLASLFLQETNLANRIPAFQSPEKNPLAGKKHPDSSSRALAQPSAQ
jgi:hypothetical protein